MKNKDGMTLVFAPGCFDSFEGSQEELDELVAKIQDAFMSGELMETAEAVEIEDLDDDIIEDIRSLTSPRKLQ